MGNVSESLRLLTKKERPWAIRSGRSEEMSDREQVAANEWIACSFERIAHLLIFEQKLTICSENRWANSQPWVKYLPVKSPKIVSFVWNWIFSRFNIKHFEEALRPRHLKKCHFSFFLVLKDFVCTVRYPGCLCMYSSQCRTWASHRLNQSR